MDSDDDKSSVRSQGISLRFSVRYFLWVTIVIVCGFCLGFDHVWRVAGLILAGSVVAFWSATWFLPLSMNGLRQAVFGGSIGFGLASLLLTVPPTGNLSEIRCDACRGRLRDLAFAVRHHLSRHDRLPDDLIGADGELVSWRARFLADLGERDFFADAGSADGEISLSAASKADKPYCYWCYNRKPYSTYFAVRGDGAVWPRADEPQGPIRDYDCDVVLLIEAPSEVYGEWYEPRDLSIDDAIALLSATPDRDDAAHWSCEGLFAYAAPLCNVAFVDGSVRTLRLPLSERDARCILTANGHEYREREVLAAAEQSRIKRDKVATWLLFGVLAIGPTFLGCTKQAKIEG